MTDHPSVKARRIGFDVKLQRKRASPNCESLVLVIGIGSESNRSRGQVETCRRASEGPSRFFCQRPQARDHARFG
jgi:hypothetical protein